MKLIITGLVYATFEPVKKVITVNLGENVDLNIKHGDTMSIISVGGVEYYLETNSLEYQLVAM